MALETGVQVERSVVLLVVGPISARHVRDIALSLLRLLAPLSPAWHGRRQALVVPTDRRRSVVSLRRDEIPDERFYLVVPAVDLQAVNHLRNNANNVSWMGSFSKKNQFAG
jgi:hypothetical protein